MSGLKRTLCVLGVLVGVALVGGQPAFADTIDLAPLADTFVSSGDPGTDNGALGYLDVYGGTSSYGCGVGAAEGLLKFDLASIPENATITSVTLMLTSYAGFAYNGDPNHHAVFLADDTWTGSTLWAGRPANGFSPGIPEGTLNGVPMSSSPDHLGFTSAYSAQGCAGVSSVARPFSSSNLAAKVASERIGDGTLSVAIIAPACGTPGSVDCFPGGTELAYFLRYYSVDGSTLLGPRLSVAYTVDPLQSGPTFTVNSTADPGDGTCTEASCTLREALEAAGTGDAITFAIPGSGPHTIAPTSELPPFYGALLDGWSQGGSGYTGPPLIAIDGSLASGDGLTVNETGAVVRGLAIGGFDGYGISVNDRNVTLHGNYIGTNAAGTAANPNASGGVYVNDTEGAVIGGSGAGEGNVISGNGGHGIELPPAYDFTIKGNLVGVGADATTQLGNSNAGILVDSCCGADGVIGGAGVGEGNTIAFNGSAGIVNTADGIVVIAGNAIYDNTGLGIDLEDDGVTANDAGDGDVERPNDLQNFPVLTAAVHENGTLTVAGSLDSVAGPEYILDFFASPSCDDSGNGEGVTYIGSATASVGNFDEVELTTEAGAGAVLTATATGPGGTSEFSVCLAITEPDNLVTNGGFELPVLGPTGFVTYGPGASLTGWTIDSGSIDHIKTFWTSFEGAQSIDLDGNSPGAISQTLATSIGQSYDVSFWSSANPDLSGGSASMSVRWGGTEVLSVTRPPAASGTSMGWVFSRVTVVATGTSTPLQFVSTDFGPFGIALDSVSVTPTAVTDVTVSADRASVEAGAGTVPLAGIPPFAFLSNAFSTSRSTPVNDVPVNDILVTDSPVNDIPVNDVGLDGLAPQLGDVLLSTVPLLRTGGWEAALAGTPLADRPLQNVSLRDVFELVPGPFVTDPLTLGDLDLTNSPLGRIPAYVWGLGDVPLSSLGLTGTTWCEVFAGPPVGCTAAPTVGFADAALPRDRRCPGQRRSRQRHSGQRRARQRHSGQRRAGQRHPLPGDAHQRRAHQRRPRQRRAGERHPGQRHPGQRRRGTVEPRQRRAGERHPRERHPRERRAGQRGADQRRPDQRRSDQRCAGQRHPGQRRPAQRLARERHPGQRHRSPRAPSSRARRRARRAAPSAITVGELKPGVTLGDLRLAMQGGDLPPNLTLGDIGGWGDTRIWGLIASLAGVDWSALSSLGQQPSLAQIVGLVKNRTGGPEPTVAHLLALIELAAPSTTVDLVYLAKLFFTNDASLAELFSLVLQSGDLGWERLDLNGLGVSQYAESSGADTVIYTVGFTAGAPGTALPQVTLPAGFTYVAGSSRVSGPGYDVPVALSDPAIAGSEVAWSIPDTTTGTWQLTFRVRAGIRLGPATTTARVGFGAVPPVEAATPIAVTVTETFPGSSYATPTPIGSDAFHLSYLTSSTDGDVYSLPAPPAGSRVTVHLSHLPVDYDLVVYGPAGQVLVPPSPGSVPLDGRPLSDEGTAPTHRTDELPPETLSDVPVAAGQTVVAISSNRTNQDEAAAFVSAGTGTYRIQVSGFNGASSNDAYMLRAEVLPPRSPVTCTPRVFPHTGTAATSPTTGPVPPGVDTVFVVNRVQFGRIFDGADASIAAITARLGDLASAGHPSVVLQVDSNAGVRSAVDAWNACPADPIAANIAAAAIGGVVRAFKDAHSTVENVVLVGSDDVNPFFRLDDHTTLSNETAYGGTFPAGSPLGGAFTRAKMLSDDPYGTLSPTPFFDRQLYVPELSVGRLVETPADINAQIDAFLGGTQPGVLSPTTATVTGYDFLTDGSQAVAAGLAAFTSVDSSLISEVWSAGNLQATFSTPADVISINAHADHTRFQAANGTLLASDVIAGAATFAGRIVFSMGCHGGLNVSDFLLPPSARSADWAQKFASSGAAIYVANTGFGYGDTDVVAYSEDLNRRFAENLGAGLDVGEALTLAKQEFKSELGLVGVYDEKAMAVLTLYGLPMYRAGAAAATASNAPSGGFAPLAAGNASGPVVLAAPAAVPTSPDPITGLDAAPFTANQNFAGRKVITASGRGSYYRGTNGLLVSHYRPIEPKAVQDTAANAHGALITELTSTDELSFDPVFARPTVDSAATEPELPYDGAAFPARLQAVTSYERREGRHHKLVLAQGQFFTTQGSDGLQTGVQRLFTHVAGQVYASSSTTYAPPTFRRIEALQGGGFITFTAQLLEASSEVKRVLVLFLDDPSSGVWRSVDLAPSAGDSHVWTGSRASSAESAQYFVQAVGRYGDVAVTTNKGFLFEGKPQLTTGSVQPVYAGTGGPTIFTSSVTVGVNVPADVTARVSVDGAPFGDPPVVVTGEGVHTVVIEASNGTRVESSFAIDTQGPKVFFTDGPPANSSTANASFVFSANESASFECKLDGGQYGPCTSPASLNSLTSGPHTFFVRGTDGFGNVGDSTAYAWAVAPCVGRAPAGAIVGGSGNTTINGTPGNDVIWDLSGNNTIDGKGGNDIICTGSGNDKVTTGQGSDIVIDTGGNNVIVTGAGGDAVSSGNGNDSITTGDGADVVVDSGGQNTIAVGNGNNKVTSAAGHDKITSGAGDDVVTDSGGNNNVETGGGVDVVTTGSGNDKIESGSQNDTIDAGDGNNNVGAGAGDDRISAGSGNDNIDGGPGYDTCLPGSGNNTVKNCEA